MVEGEEKEKECEVNVDVIKGKVRKGSESEVTAVEASPD